MISEWKGRAHAPDLPSRAVADGALVECDPEGVATGVPAGTSAGDLRVFHAGPTSRMERTRLTACSM